MFKTCTVLKFMSPNFQSLRLNIVNCNHSVRNGTKYIDRVLSRFMIIFHVSVHNILPDTTSVHTSTINIYEHVQIIYTNIYINKVVEQPSKVSTLLIQCCYLFSKYYVIAILCPSYYTMPTHIVNTKTCHIF